MNERKIKRVTDAETLKAVSHRLRARLLGALRMFGPATASELGRRFSESSGSTSYHLRVLAKHGFIEEDPEQPNERDRRWRASHWSTSWDDADFHVDPAGAEVARAMRRRQLEFMIEASQRYESDMDSWGPAWQKAAGLSDRMLRLRAATLTELKTRIHELVTEYERRDADAEAAEFVRLYLGAFPLDESQFD